MALTQKGTQRIEIIVRKAGGSGMTGAKEKSADKANTEQEGNEEAKGLQNGSKKSEIWWRTQTTHAMAVAKQVSTQWVGYLIAGIGDQQGDQALQQQINREIEVIGDVTNVASAVAMGATYGSAGGLPGMILGASMMGIQAASSIGVKYATREREYKMTLFKENNAIEYKRARAQINLTTGRLR